MSRLLLIENIGELVTMQPLTQRPVGGRVKPEEVGRITNAWLACLNGQVVAYGTQEPPEVWTRGQCFDAEGQLVIPGLVDCHTHPLFAGSRAHEFCQRLEGRTYQEIAAAGGGILSTVGATRKAADEELKEHLRRRLGVFLSHGVTTVEAKSGYGLSPQEELRHLRLLHQVADHSPQHVVTTCLALHAKSPDYASLAEYVKVCSEELLPSVAEEKLANFVDAFVEEGYFSAADVEPYLAKAQALGLGIRLHADEFTSCGGAALAAQWRAASADHLQYASAEGIAAMAKAKVCAVLLPGTSLATGIPFTAAPPFLDQGCPLALATDYNPGSCPVDNLRLILSLAAVHCKIDPWTALAAVTYVPAISLGVGQQKGSLAAGFDADLVILPLTSVEEFVADFGRSAVSAVFTAGEMVFSNGPVLQDIQ